MHVILRALHEYVDVSMLLPLALAQVRFEVAEQLVTDANLAMIELEQQTGHHPYIAPYTPLVLEDTNIDFIHLTKELNSTSTQVGITQFRLEALLLHLTSIEDELSASTLPIQASHLKQHTHFMRSQIQNMLLRINHLNRKAQNQLSVVYNLMAQRDSQLNIQIASDSRDMAIAAKADLKANLQVAQDSKNIAAAAKSDSAAMRTVAAAAKRDSSDMKSIAFVTLAFLPGTFIAAMFAMPLFNWQAASGEPIVTARFAIYWAVALPLTFGVLGTWMLLMRKKKREARDDGEEFDQQARSMSGDLEKMVKRREGDGSNGRWTVDDQAMGAPWCSQGVLN
ncbi:MAG: hypothetical protein Q9164_002996 [Protoblastenia rupestris]